MSWLQEQYGQGAGADAGLTGGNMDPGATALADAATGGGQRQNRLQYRQAAAANNPAPPPPEAPPPPAPTPYVQPGPQLGASQPYGQEIQRVLADVRAQLGVGPYQEGPNPGVINQFLRAGATTADIVNALRRVRTAQGDFSGQHGSDQRRAYEQWAASRGIGNAGRGWGAKAQNQPNYQRPQQYSAGGGPNNVGPYRAGGSPGVSGVGTTQSFTGGQMTPQGQQNQLGAGGMGPSVYRPPQQTSAMGQNISRSRPQQPGMSTNDYRNRTPAGTYVGQGQRIGGSTGTVANAPAGVSYRAPEQLPESPGTSTTPPRRDDTISQYLPKILQYF